MIAAPLTVAAVLVVARAGAPPPPARPLRPIDRSAPARRRSDVAIARRLATADLDLGVVSPTMVWAAFIGLAMLAGFSLVGPAAGVVGATVGLVAPPVVVRVRGDRHRARIERALPGLLDEVAMAIHGGDGLLGALTSVTGTGPLERDLANVLARVERGQTLAHALRDWAASLGSPDVDLVVMALDVGLQTGGSHRSALQGVAQSLRDRAEVAAELRALVSQGRTSAVVVGVAPVGFAAVAAAVDPATMAFFTRTRVGPAVVAAGLALDAVGVWWMQRLANPS